MNDDPYPAAKARDSATIEQQIMDPCIAKNDAEWWAMGEIERLRDALKSIARFGDVDLTSQWEGGLRDIISSMTDCACGYCSRDVQHASSCAVHNPPASPAGPCNCGATTRLIPGFDRMDYEIAEMRVIEGELWARLRLKEKAYAETR